jgi:hypothetical protein
MVVEHPREDRMTNSNAIYARFEALEERLAHCYFLLQERFINDPPLAKFWLEAALDELQHSSILRFCRERGILANVDVGFSTADHVDMLLDTVKKIVSDPGVTVDEAFYASMLMEGSELDETYEKLTRALLNDHLSIYEAIRASLRTHHDRFADAAAEFSNDQAYAEAFKAFGRAEKRALAQGVSL